MSVAQYTNENNIALPKFAINDQVHPHPTPLKTTHTSTQNFHMDIYINVTRAHAHTHTNCTQIMILIWSMCMLTQTRYTVSENRYNGSNACENSPLHIMV